MSRASCKPRAPVFVALAHWLVVGLLGTGALTGLRLAWADGDARHGSTADIVAPEGDVLTWHIAAGHALAIAVVAFAAYAIVVARRQSRRRKRRAHVWLRWASLGAVGVAVASGVALDSADDGLAVGAGTLRSLHIGAIVSLVPIALAHAVLEWLRASPMSLLRLRVRRRDTRALAIAIAVAAPITAIVAAGASSERELVVARVPADRAVPVLDGDPADAIWRSAEAVTVHTAHGENFVDGSADIQVRAVRDGSRIYLLMQWADPTPSLEPYPLVKTADGWRVAETRRDRADETIYYEDKLAVSLSTDPRGCASTCHLGTDPAGVGYRATRGLHYTDGDIVDMWHWKAARSNPAGERVGDVGFMDDQYVGSPVQPPLLPGARYTGGYHADPGAGGGYRWNVADSAPVRPLAVPRRGARGWLHAQDAEPYDPRAHDYRVGTVLPGVIIAPLTGDRGDVRAAGAWRDGIWTLEASRALATGSDRDVDLASGRTVYLSVAAFDHAQTRHTRHAAPLRLVVSP